MKKFEYLIVIAIISLILVSCGSTDNDNDHLNLKITPSSQIISIDEELTCQVKVNNAENLFAASMEIVFNGNLVELPEGSMNVGSVWGDDAFSSSVNEIDRLNVAIGFTDSGSDNSIEGEATLFEFKVVGKVVGETEIFIHSLNLLNEAGEAIDGFAEIEIENSVVTVQ